MIRCAVSSIFAIAFALAASGQAPSPDKSDSAAIEALSKKIDVQNAKIDALSQEILKLQQHISSVRPGVIIGETPAPATGVSEATRPTQTGNSHVVAKGETLTSIAKMHKVTIEELQRLNHIENPLKLQIGQTITIPAPVGATSPSASPTPAA
jgi:LysM repeat protein